MPLSVAASNAKKSDDGSSSSFTFDTSGVLAGDLVAMVVQWHHDFDVLVSSPTVDTIQHNSAGISGVGTLFQWIGNVVAASAAPTYTFTFGSGLPYYAQMVAIRGGATVAATGADAAAWGGNTPPLPALAYTDGDVLLGFIFGYDPSSIPSITTEPVGFTRVLLTRNTAIVFDGQMVESTAEVMIGSGTASGLFWETSNLASPNAYRFAYRMSPLLAAGDPPTPTPPMIHGRGAC